MSVTVLHIEDRKENRLLVRKLLERSGFTVVDAVDGLSGIELAGQCDPGLVLVDINIPGLDGYAVVTKLRSMPVLDGVPIVAITAEGDRDHSLALGFDGFISKPIRIATFVKQIQGFLAGEREAAQVDQTAHLRRHSRHMVDHLAAKVRELTHANARLQEVDRLKMEVLRNVSHELSTPMTPLMGYVRMLVNEELGPLAKPQKDVLSRMAESLTRLGGLIDNLLNVTRFATGAVALEPSMVDPAQVVAEAVRGRADAAAARGVDVEVSLDLTETVMADHGRLVEALRQVLDNAIKFGPEGGRVRVGAALHLVDEGDARFVDLVVEDQGPGIPADQRARVVEPFYQIDGSATRDHGGAGLGLAVVQQTAELHGGALLIEGSAEGGARVVLRVPTRVVQG